MVGRISFLVMSVGVLLVLTFHAAAQGPEKVRKPKFNKVESELSALAEEAILQKSTAARERLAAKAPLHKATAVAVSVWVDKNADDLAEYLKTRGVDVRNVGTTVVEAYIELADVPWVAAQPGVVRMSLMRPGKKMAVTSQGVVSHNALAVQAAGVTGQGVRVGVIDVGFRDFQRLQGTELPTAVAARCYTGVGTFTSSVADCERDTNHGTAVAEAVMDIAPGVTLFISNPGPGLDLRQTVDWLISQGVRVINFSEGITWEGPGDGTSIFEASTLASVDRAVRGGSVFVAAAGNEDLSTWTGPFRDANGNGLLEMSGVELNGILGLSAGTSFSAQLRWADEWPRAATDLDLLLFDPAGNFVKSSADSQAGRAGDIPREYLEFTASQGGEYKVAIQHDSGPTPAYVQIQVFSGQPLRARTSGYSVANPAESFNLGLLAVGAADWRTPQAIESFSGRGPTFDNRFKPDIVGVDRGDSATLGSVAFAGTSQASPHVAGLIALLTQLFPSLFPEQIATSLVTFAQTRANVRPNLDWGFGFAFIPTGSTGSQPIAFPPRTESFAFRNQLEGKYRDGLRRNPSTSFADPEGSVVWTTEYLRYRLNQCDNVGAILRVLTQIAGRGVQAVCGQPPTGVINFPPRNETVTFRSFLDSTYRNTLGRSPVQTFVDQEGDVVWISEYTRYRLNGCSHDEAVARVMLQIDGRGVQPICP